MLLTIECSHYNHSWVFALAWEVGEGGWCSLWNSSFTSYVSLCEIAVTVAILFSRNEVLAGELSSHKETYTGLSSCLTVTVSSIVPQAAQGQWCRRPRNRRAAGLEQEAGDLRWCLFHSMLPSALRGIRISGDRMSSPGRRSAQPSWSTRKFMGVFPNGCQQTSHVSLKGLFRCFAPFTPLPSSYEIERWFPGPRVWATYMRAIRAFISSFLLPFKASYPSLSPLCIAHPNKSHCG